MYRYLVYFVVNIIASVIIFYLFRLKEIYRNPTNDEEVPITLTFHTRMFFSRKPKTSV